MFLPQELKVFVLHLQYFTFQVWNMTIKRPNIWTAVVPVPDILQSFNQPLVFCFPHSLLLSYMIFFLAFTGFVDKIHIFTLVFWAAQGKVEYGE